MKSFLYRFLFVNWFRKLIALLFAVITWMLVTQTMTTTRTLSNIPVRVIHLPKDKTVIGLLPNGLLKYRISITISGYSSVVSQLRPTDLEIIIDATDKKDSWIASIDKHNLISITDHSDWKNAISSVSSNDLYIKMSQLICEDIPIRVNTPIGDPPSGYQFLDVWPKYLIQKVCGPQEQIYPLKESGLDITFNLNRITASDVVGLETGNSNEELCFFIPEAWKTITLPFKGAVQETLNDPRAKLLRIDFLKRALIPLGTELPISIFFPFKYSRTMNPQTYSLPLSSLVEKKNGIRVLTLPLYVKDVSRLFLDVVRDHLLLLISVEPNQERLHWSVECVNDAVLEEIYLQASLKEAESLHKENLAFSQNSEDVIRSRFRQYVRSLQLYTANGDPLSLLVTLGANEILVEQPRIEASSPLTRREIPLTSY